MKKRFVIYARKSSEGEDRQVQSIDDQINYFINRFSDHPDYEIVQNYAERKSAKAPDVRPEFQKMIKLIQRGDIHGILCWKLDRLSRNPVDSGTIQYMLQR